MPYGRLPAWPESSHYEYWALVATALLLLVLASPSTGLALNATHCHGSNTTLPSGRCSEGEDAADVTICVAENAAPWVFRKDSRGLAHTHADPEQMPLAAFLEEFQGFDTELLNAIRM